VRRRSTANRGSGRAALGLAASRYRSVALAAMRSRAAGCSIG
jgi:hypothetical protein